MRHKFGWDLPPEVTNRMIEEQAGAFEEEEVAQEMEKLVEEIRLVWCEDCADGPSRYEYSADLDDDVCEGGVETVKLCRERARKCIILILSALRKEEK